MVNDIIQWVPIKNVKSQTADVKVTPDATEPQLRSQSVVVVAHLLGKAVEKYYATNISNIFILKTALSSYLIASTSLVISKRTGP